MGEAIGQEAKALGATQLFAPEADLARELRYGRVSELLPRMPCGNEILMHVKTIGRGNIRRRPFPGRRDRLQLREGYPEQECVGYGQALCSIQ